MLTESYFLSYMKLSGASFALIAGFLVSPAESHSWIEKIDGGYGVGVSRIGMNSKDDLVRQRYFCPLATLAECDPYPKHNIIPFSQMEDSPMRPCRADKVSDPRAAIKLGENIRMNWAGNGHVGNGQSDGTCVRVMIAPYEADPDFGDFIQIPGAECLDFWITKPNGIQSPEGTINIPENLVTPGDPYVLLWYWNFTDFWYSACIDIDVLPLHDGTTPSPTPPPTWEMTLVAQEDYLKNGCTSSGLQGLDNFCARYTTEPASYCDAGVTDECGRSVCLYADFLLPCPDCSPINDCPSKAFYDDFSSGLDPNKWLVAHKSWGGGNDGFTNGGVVEENVEIDQDTETVIFHAHGSLYTGSVMGINKDLSRKNTGVRTGGAIATREYFGAGSYEVRMKVAPQLGVCSAIWTFFYNEDDHSTDPGKPIVNHEIDIEIPGRPGPAIEGIDFDQALLNTWVGELNSLYTANYTPLPSRQDDGQFHTWRFDWHTDSIDPRVEFYVDGAYLKTTREHIPFYGGRLWIGAWFPNKWAGEPDFEHTQMDVDYVRFTPFDEAYECPEESYPNFGWAPGTVFSESSDGTESVKCNTPGPLDSPTSSPTTATPPTSPPVAAPMFNDESLQMYHTNGCKDLSATFCETQFSGSYCKDWNIDGCGRSVCQGDSHNSLNVCPVGMPTPLPPTPAPPISAPPTSLPPSSPPTAPLTAPPASAPTAPPTPPPTAPPVPPPSNEEVYLNSGCIDLPQSFCGGYNGGYCKSWSKDGCGRAVCQGDSHSNLHPCS